MEANDIGKYKGSAEYEKDVRKEAKAIAEIELVLRVATSIAQWRDSVEFKKFIENGVRHWLIPKYLRGWC